MSVVPASSKTGRRVRPSDCRVGDLRSSNQFVPRVGEPVRVRHASDLLEILRVDGRTDGLPFHAQMLNWCGATLNVRRWAVNVCYQTENVAFGALENCVVLETPRCNGAGFGDCQLGCTLFWKTDWLEDPTAGSSVLNLREESEAMNELQRVIQREAVKKIQDKVQGELPIYQCQGSQLAKIVTQTSKLNARGIRDQHNLNQTSVSTLVSDMCSTLMAKAKGRQSGYSGPCKKTPIDTLQLEVGTQVRVKPLEEIIQTLDSRGKNRGLWYDPAMDTFAGEIFTVSRRVTHFVDERTGKMICTSVPSIVLEDLHCDGRMRRYCSRLLQFFWREIWLERV